MSFCNYETVRIFDKISKNTASYLIGTRGFHHNIVICFVLSILLTMMFSIVFKTVLQALDNKLEIQATEQTKDIGFPLKTKPRTKTSLGYFN